MIQKPVRSIGVVHLATVIYSAICHPEKRNGKGHIVLGDLIERILVDRNLRRFAFDQQKWDQFFLICDNIKSTVESVICYFSFHLNQPFGESGNEQMLDY